MSAQSTELNTTEFTNYYMNGEQKCYAKSYHLNFHVPETKKIPLDNNDANTFKHENYVSYKKDSAIQIEASYNFKNPVEYRLHPLNSMKSDYSESLPKPSIPIAQIQQDPREQIHDNANESDRETDNKSNECKIFLMLGKCEWTECPKEHPNGGKRREPKVERPNLSAETEKEVETVVVQKTCDTKSIDDQVVINLPTEHCDEANENNYGNNTDVEENKSESSQSIVVIDDEMPDDEITICSYCDKEFPSSELLDRHLIEIHEVNITNHQTVKFATFENEKHVHNLRTEEIENKSDSSASTLDNEKMEMMSTEYVQPPIEEIIKKTYSKLRESFSVELYSKFDKKTDDMQIDATNFENDDITMTSTNDFLEEEFNPPPGYYEGIEYEADNFQDLSKKKSKENVLNEENSEIEKSNQNGMALSPVESESDKENDNTNKHNENGTNEERNDKENADDDISEKQYSQVNDEDEEPMEEEKSSAKEDQETTNQDQAEMEFTDDADNEYNVDSTSVDKEHEEIINRQNRMAPSQDSADTFGIGVQSESDEEEENNWNAEKNYNATPLPPERATTDYDDVNRVSKKAKEAEKEMQIPASRSKKSLLNVLTDLSNGLPKIPSMEIPLPNDEVIETNFTEKEFQEEDNNRIYVAKNVKICEALSIANNMFKKNSIAQKKCLHCGKRFSHKQGLNRHIKDKHDELQNPECPKCGKKIAVNRLQRHIDVVHNGKAGHKCDICGKTFSKNSNKNAHMKSVHQQK